MVTALPKAYLERMRRLLGDGYSAYLDAMQDVPPRCLRVNRIKTSPEALLALLGDGFRPNGVCPDGFLTPDGFLCGRHPLHAAGLMYLQEAAAQMPAMLLDVQPGMTVLDLCAAPGGKSGQLASALCGTGLLVSNEIDRGRAQVLTGNLERLGVKNAVVTSMPPDALCQALGEAFDAVLVDAPCAGEGMFRRDPGAVAAWSPAHVLACAARQRAILAAAAGALKKGGRLVYATCSFSEEENEQTVRAFLADHPDFWLVCERRLYPHTVAGEGQYAALLQRSGVRTDSVFRLARPDRCDEWIRFADGLVAPLPGSLRVLPDSRVLLLPTLPFSIDPLRVMRAGLLLGEVRNGRFVPAHALAMAGADTPFLCRHPVCQSEAEEYLQGQTLPACGQKGYLAVTFCGHALGIGKASDGVVKNHYPKGLRLAPASCLT